MIVVVARRIGGEGYAGRWYFRRPKTMDTVRFQKLRKTTREKQLFLWKEEMNEA
jgi:hypothetical protein